MEASALPAPSGLARTRISLGPPLLRLRSDEQLVSLFRDGNTDAFRVIHDRYRQRLFAYTRQMLPGSRQDAEDALQDVFVRAFGGLQANHRELALRAWLYRIAHNRCIDELRRPAPPAPEVMELVRPPDTDPIAEAEQRESLRRLISDVRRLPEQQRSALLMRELGGMTYTEIAAALSVSVPAVKSLLVRARVGLAQAAEARDTSCHAIREDLIVSHDRGVRPTGIARRHMRDCPGCREFRGRLRGTSRQFAALLPAIGPVGMVAKVLGFGGGGSAAAGGGAAAVSGAVGTGGSVAAGGVLATGAGHVVTFLAAAAVTAGGAVEIQHTIAPSAHRTHHHAVISVQATPASLQTAPMATPPAPPKPRAQPPVAATSAAAQAPAPAVARPRPRPAPTFTAPVVPATITPPASTTPPAPPPPVSNAPGTAGDGSTGSTNPAGTGQPGDPGSGTSGGGSGTTGTTTPGTTSGGTGTTPPVSGTTGSDTTPSPTGTGNGTASGASSGGSATRTGYSFTGTTGGGGATTG